MSRKAHGRQPGRVVRYIPTAFGNTEDPAPVAIVYRVPNERERRELMASGDSVVVSGAGPSQQIKIDSSASLRKQHDALRLCVVSVENYEDASGRPIVDGLGLAEHGESEIVFEVVSQIMASAEPGEEAKKN